MDSVVDCPLAHSERKTAPIMKQAVLTIAGSDSSGGAGIQADIKSMAANGVYALSVLTAVTAQNTLGISKAFPLPLDIVEAQLDAVFADIPVACAKTGMLSTAAIVESVSRKIRQSSLPHLIVDPVMMAKDGHPLLERDAIDALKHTLIPQATLCTPNIAEAEVLSQTTIRNLAEAREAAKIVWALGCRNVLITGGHLAERPGTDLLYDGRFFTMYPAQFVDTPHTHGTGCTLASAIAAHLANGVSLPDAIDRAKRYLTEAIRHGFPVGHGQGPPDHLYFLTHGQESHA